MEKDYGNEQIVITTLGKINNLLKGRNKIDISELRCFILDEADDFFMDEKRQQELETFHAAAQKTGKHVQYILFSATYDPHISDKISELVKEANQI